MRTLWFPPLVLVFLCLCGCRDDGVVLVPVSGNVTLNGQPLAHAKVMFQPDATGRAPSSEGTTDSHGHYQLAVTVLGRDGAMPGVHKVTICAAAAPKSSDDSVVSVPEPIPARYNTKTTLTFEVSPEGTGAADFALRSP
jgi:hypothetical protein